MEATKHWTADGYGLSKTEIRKLNQAAIAIGLVLKQRKNGIRVRWYNSVVHGKLSRRETTKTCKEKAGLLCLKLCRDHLNGRKSSGTITDQQAAEYLELEKMVKRAGINKGLVALVGDAIRIEQQRSSAIHKDLTEAWGEYFAYYKSTRAISKSSLEEYETCESLVIKPLDGVCLLDMGEKEWLEHVNSVATKRRWGRETYRKRLGYVAGFLRWARGDIRRWIPKTFDTDQLYELLPKKEAGYAQYKPRYFTLDQFLKILDCSETNGGRRGKMNYRAINSLRGWSAARFSEILCLDHSEINWAEREATVCKLKEGGGYRLIDLHPALVSYFEDNDLIRDEGPIVPEHYAAKYWDLLKEAKQCAENHRKFSKAKQEKLSALITDVAGQISSANRRWVAKRAGVEWIHNGPRHSYGTHRFKVLRSGSGRVESAKARLCEEMGTSIEMLDKHYINVGNLSLNEANDYFGLA